MKREEVLEILLAKIGKSPIVSTTGKTSREIFEIREERGEDHKYDFLTVGSMGCAIAVGLGIALNSKKNVFVIDGDGAVLMKMGALATVGTYAPKNLFHVVIDNGVYESTGSQSTSSLVVDWEQLFKATGYKSVALVERKEQLESIDLVSQVKPAALVVKVNAGSREDLGRPTTTPTENKEAFMKFLQS